jgi:hypothetical protein
MVCFNLPGKPGLVWQIKIPGGSEMSKLKKYAVITLILSGLSILALGLSQLALTDIYHGGEDLSLEWSLLRMAAIIFIAFITSTILTLKQVLKINV